MYPAECITFAGPGSPIHRQILPTARDHRHVGPSFCGPFSNFCICPATSIARCVHGSGSGRAVYGFGEKDAAPLFTACDKFVYFDVLSAAAPEVEASAATDRNARKPVATAEAVPPISKPPLAKPPLDQSALDMLTKAVIASADEDGRANLAASAGIWRSRRRISTLAIMASRASPSWSRPPVSWTWKSAATARKSSRSNSRPLPQRSESINRDMKINRWACGGPLTPSLRSALDPRSSQDDFWPERHDPGRVDAQMARVIVMFDMKEVDRLGDARQMVKLLQVAA